uniref:poly [ADP-ribose] polymerase 1 n=1 Tax=Myxine glutinosa TaxID=7769 RepID=UPI00358E437B
MSSAPDMAYKAEYAKSSRASCKKCGENIAKDSLRLALMVQSHMFDGKVPHWHHFECFFNRARPAAATDVDGLSELRWQDQEKIKKAIETGEINSGKKSGKNGDAKEKVLGDFAVEYAKSNRSKCKGCEEKIAKDTIRISKKAVDPEKPQLGLIDRWYHPACFTSQRAELGFLPSYSVANIVGFSLLNAADCSDLQKRLPAVKTEGKRKPAKVEPDGILSKKTKLSDQDTEEDKLLKDQTKKMWSFKDSLTKVSSEIDLKELLIANGQKVPVGETVILERLADGMLFGGLLPCEECKQGQLVSESDAYHCTGNISAWTKCQAKTKTPERKPWVIPKELQVNKFLKNYKFKPRERIFRSAQVVTEVVQDVESIPDVKPPVCKPKPEKGKPLAGQCVLLVGKMQRNKEELKKLIDSFGGNVVSAVEKANLCLSTKREVEKMGRRMEEVRAARMCVVSEDLLTEIGGKDDESCMELKDFENLVQGHAISGWGVPMKSEEEPDEKPLVQDGSGQGEGIEKPKKSGKSSRGKGKVGEGSGKTEKKQKLMLKGGAAVDPDSGLESTAHVHEEGSKIYSATLGQVDIVKGTNSYYKLQLLEADNKNRYWVFRSWGRVGTTIGGNKLEKMNSLETAIDNFVDLYDSKTGNSWYCEKFVKYPNKFYPMEIDYGRDNHELQKLTQSAGIKSLLDPAIQDLMQLIFDVDNMKKAMVEFEIDLQKMPLGKLSRRQIQSAYSLLGNVQKLLSQSSSESQILDMSNRFFTLIPHDFGMKKPPMLDNLEYIQSKVEMLDNLLEIEVAYSLLSCSQDGDKNQLDVNYERLKAKIEVLDMETDEARVILDYVHNTHAPTHDSFTIEVQQIFKVCRDGERQKFRPFEDVPNHMMLWHGSRITNFAGILSQGLRIAPPEAPVTGYMFGKGVYFADMVSKSANYCHANHANPTGLIMLAEVALGNMYELKEAKNVTKLPKGKHSVKGLGKTVPDPSSTVKMDGMDVPKGKPVDCSINNCHLLYNEYIVYDVAQVNVKYLLKLNFNFTSHPLW